MAGLAQDIRTAWRRGPGAWRDVAIASWELALANVAFRRTPPGELPLLRRAQRVAYMVPIMGERMPWRSDCVVQALAARRWLARGGIASNVCIGVRKDARDLQAHAWLKVGERIVTGGDVSTYAELPPSRLHRSLFARLP